jgi:hypothetical protein
MFSKISLLALATLGATVRGVFIKEKIIAETKVETTTTWAVSPGNNFHPAGSSYNTMQDCWNDCGKRIFQWVATGKFVCYFTGWVDQNSNNLAS